MKTLKKLPFLFVVTVFVSILFQSCSDSNDISNNSSQKSENNLALYREGDNLDIYITEHIKISNRIIDLLSKEGNMHFDGNALNEISTFTTNEELKHFFSENGIVNSEDLVNLLEELHTNSKRFIDNDLTFSNMSDNEKAELIRTEITNRYSQVGNNFPINIIPINTELGRSCMEQLTIDTNRCRRDYVINLGLSWVGGVLTGGVGGALAFAASVIVYNNCNSDAAADYWDCVEG